MRVVWQMSQRIFLQHNICTVAVVYYTISVEISSTVMIYNLKIPVLIPYAVFCLVPRPPCPLSDRVSGVLNESQTLRSKSQILLVTGNFILS